MPSTARLLVSIVVISGLVCQAARGQDAGVQHKEATVLPAGSQDYALSREAYDLGQQIKVIPLMERLKILRAEFSQLADDKKAEKLELRQQITEIRQDLNDIITQTSLEIDAVKAQIGVEVAQALEILRAYNISRDRSVALTNAVGFTANGALWAIAEALDIPTFKRPRYSVSSGTIGILAGLVPTAASLYALKLADGHHYSRRAEPNMLSRIFDYEVPAELDYPASVWNFLNSVPYGEKSGRTRREILIHRWIDDNYIPAFKHRDSKRQIGLVTAENVPRRAVTISVIGSRLTMLDQLGAEIYNIKKDLLELMRTVRQ